ncbi:cellulose biosynthesis cyclic di-GMP-binding regulatory protein BcsB [Gorillibacterium timonense]|uniref:cellulose biosynthesis cyclic di-GMP-binding regulatory protein BcsB n=1 Tax=Gorillibacterium timonense TaxID=1689269 RepID=UPI00071E005C|nr:cellulose biosynthesis cyclic di-GMP-binding regulatory protein BcsB [Gorillibacterium timonense]
MIRKLLVVILSAAIVYPTLPVSAEPAAQASPSALASPSGSAGSTLQMAPAASAVPSPAPTGTPVQADNPGENGVTGSSPVGKPDPNHPVLVRDSQFLTADVSMKGPDSIRQDYFYLPAYWQPDTVTLSLDYRITQLALPEQTSLTLSINGHPFYSLRPKEAATGKQRLTVTIPRELLVTGDNLLRMEGVLRTEVNEEICLDEEASPAEWIHLYPTSTLRIAYRETAPEGSIRDFYTRLTGFDKLEAGKSLVLVSSKESAEEWEAAVHALSGFSRSDTRADKAIPLSPYATDKEKTAENTVLIALYDQLPAEWQVRIDGSGLEQAARIQLIREGQRSVLVATSRSPELLVKAGRFLGNPQLMQETLSSSVQVDANTKVETPAVEISKTVTLTAAGDQVKGSRHQELSYYVPLPAGRTLANSGKILLDFRYAKNLDFDRSMVTVLLNGTPIGSKKLTAELADGDTATLSVPKNLNVSGNLTVTVAFDLELKGSSCIKGEQQMPWAYLTKDSKLLLHTKDNTELLFNNYPNPFLRDGVYNQVGLVLPSERSETLYQAVSDLIHLFGRYTEGNTGDVKVFGPGATAEELKDRNLIAVGTYGDNPVIRSSNDKLYFRFSEDGTRIDSNEKLSIEESYGQTVGTLQLLASPYGAGKGMLAVTGPKPEGYRLAAELLGSDQSRWRIYGDGVLTDKDGTVQAFRFKQQANEEESTLVEDILHRPDALAFTLTVVTVLVLAIIALLLLIRKHGKKRRR